MNSQTNHLGALTGMRFFAAMAVVVFHLIVDHDGDGFGRFGLPANSAAIGGAAVSFFFVLSGFILTYVYKDQLTYGGVKKFYYKRWARIWPLHLVCLIVSIYVVNMTLKRYDILAVNLLLLQSWVPNNEWVFSFNGVSWSISCEMFFYFMFPFFLIGGQKRFWIKYILLWVVVLGAVGGMQLLANNPDWVNYDFDRSAHVNPLLRLPEFCTGMAVGFLFFNCGALQKKRGFVSDTVVETLALGLIPVFCWVYNHYKVTWLIRYADWGGSVTALWVQYASMVFVFAVVVFVFSRSNGFFAKLLGSRPLVYLGEISFALYMIHFLVIVGIDAIDWSASAASPWILGACAISISICLAAMLYTFVEMPAKSGLMSLYGGEVRKSAMAFPTAIGRSLKSPTVWSYGLVLALSFAAMRLAHVPLNTDEQMRMVVNASHAPYQDVDFGDVIRLLGAKASASEKGIELKLVWQKKSPVNRNRFLHFCDEEGNILSQLPPEQEFYEDAPLRQPVLESFLLPNEKLADEKITQIGIGFYSAEIDPATNKPFPMLTVSKGLRGMSNCRLHVIGQNEMKNLRVKLAGIAAKKAVASDDDGAVKEGDAEVNESDPVNSTSDQ